MARSADALRVAKGIRKVAKAFLDAEGPAVANQALRMKEHGVGVSTSLKDAVSSALFSVSHQHPTASDAANQTPSNAMGDATSARNGDAARPPPVSNRVNVDQAASIGSKVEMQQELQSSSLHAADVSEKPVDNLVDMKVSVSTHESNDDDAAMTGQDRGRMGGSMLAGSLESRERDEVGGEVAPVKRPTKIASDESGPWAFAQAAADSVGAGDAGAGKVKDVEGASGAARRGGMTNSRTRTVPSSPLARVFGFGQLAAGLAMGTVAEAVRQSVGGGDGGVGGREGGHTSRKQSGTVKKYVASDANAERLAETLCRMRGAALKLGQMLSIQDESVIPPSLAKALDRVRQGADVMPVRQLHRQLEKSLGADWKSRIASFDETPIAAASIGQVHRARLLDGTEVVMKIQYPGVANSVESDLKNLQRLVQLTNILPPGLYIDEIIKVAREELGEECDYEKEAENQERFRVLVESDENLSKWASVPRVVPGLLSKEVLTTHLAPGVPVDHVLPMPQEVRNHVARIMLRCTINELFDWRFMQTDPNWGNFLFDRETGKMSLIDFGACREYRKDFVDDYLRLVWSAANRDEGEIMRVSQQLKFLTGDETPSMMKAHLQAGLVVGEPFVDREGKAFDFHGSNITARLSQHGDTFMKHRLTPPPREAYSLHRKLAGAFLMNIKLKATIPCRDILEDVHDRYSYG